MSFVFNAFAVLTMKFLPVLALLFNLLAGPAPATSGTLTCHDLGPMEIECKTTIERDADVMLKDLLDLAPQIKEDLIIYLDGPTYTAECEYRPSTDEKMVCRSYKRWDAR